MFFPQSNMPPWFRLLSASLCAIVVLAAESNHPFDANEDELIALMRQRRLSSILSTTMFPSVLASSAPPADIQSWIDTIDTSGKWPDTEINYATGCDARRANWPAQWHWQRLLVMSAAWHGGLSSGWEDVEQWVGSEELRSAVENGTQWWFDRDYEGVGCLQDGGTAACPCGTPGMWNTNWYSNVILIPNLVSQVCLLLDSPPDPSLSTLSQAQLDQCTNFVTRAYGVFDHGFPLIVGANTLDISKGAIDSGLLISNITMLNDAYDRVHREVSIQKQPKADGIRPDGSFGHHAGLLYNGNYGKDYLNVDLELELTAATTPYAAGQSSIDALEVLVDANRWMIFQNTETGVKFWDYSVLPRFITFPVVDGQASSGIRINMTRIETLGEQWNSDIMKTFVSSLADTTPHGNAGNLVGNRVFYANDYIVHRGENYVSTLKMVSSRTLTTECVNSQNPFGFHLSDGTRYTHITGTEYTDVFAAWDWNLIPGTTSSYGSTPLTCETAEKSGLETFVGGVSTGETGIGVMKYTNPITGSFGWQKAWFFLKGDREHVMVGNVSWGAGEEASVRSVLDQKRWKGEVLVDGTDIAGSSEWEEGGSMHEGARSLWHDGVGYVFSVAQAGATVPALVVQVGERPGNWSKIGTSTQPPHTVDLFAAYLEHEHEEQSQSLPPISYTTFSAISSADFTALLDQDDPAGITELQHDDAISAILDSSHSMLYAVFWDAAGGTLNFTCPDGSAGSLYISQNAAVILDIGTEPKLTASDPGQSVESIAFEVDLGTCVGGEGLKESGSLAMPTDGEEGKSVTMRLG